MKGVFCIRVMLVVLVVTTMSACTLLKRPETPVKSEVEPVSAVEVGPFTHTIKYSGETYGVIARWYTSDAKNWKAIADANPKVSPTKMRIGDTIQIPRDLLRQDKPLPKEFVKKSAVAAIPAQPLSEPEVGEQPSVATESEEVEMVAPKTTSPEKSAPVVAPTSVPTRAPEKQPVVGAIEPAETQTKRGGALLDDGEQLPTMQNGKARTAPVAPASVEQKSQGGTPSMSEEEINKAKLLNELLQ